MLGLDQRMKPRRTILDLIINKNIFIGSHSLRLFGGAFQPLLDDLLRLRYAAGQTLL